MRKRFQKYKCPTATDSFHAFPRVHHVTRPGIRIGARVGSWVLLVGLVPVVAYGADRPDWAFPVTDKVQPPSTHEGEPTPPPGSTKSYTRAQIDDLSNPPDWF